LRTGFADEEPYGEDRPALDEHFAEVVEAVTVERRYCRGEQHHDAADGHPGKSFAYPQRDSGADDDETGDDRGEGKLALDERLVG